MAAADASTAADRRARSGHQATPQDRWLVEADPVNLQALKSIQLDPVKFKIGVCAGVAIGVDGDMYVIGWHTEEMVRMTRDGQTALGRVDLAALDLSRRPRRGVVKSPSWRSASIDRG